MSFKLAEPFEDAVGRTVERPQAAGSVYLQGALLLVDANGAYAECAANPATIAAVAASDAGPDTSGFNVFSTKGFPPGKMQGYVIKGKTFICNYVGTLPAADGAVYGVVRDTDSKWKVNFADTANARVKLVGRRTNSPENLPVVLVRFIDANVQDI